VGWSASFLSAMKGQRLAPSFRARVVQPANNDAPGGAADLPAVAGLVVQSSRVSPQQWTSTLGGFSLDLAVTHPASVHNYVRRGSIIEVLVGWEGWDEASYEPVARGRVRQVTGYGPSVRLECADLVSSTISRPSASSITQASLFYDAGAPVGPYTATSSGNHAVTATTFPMTAAIDATQFTRRTGGAGLLKVDDGTAAVYYMTYTGISGANFTGCAIVGSFGSTKPAITLSGATVTHVPYMRGHPFDIVRWVLCSTGSGSNGAYDVLPKPWGLAMDDDWIDHSDVDYWRGSVVTATSGTYEWEVKVESRQTSGLSWLTSLLVPAGLWLTMRQGQLTMRAAQFLYPFTIASGVTITDEDWTGEPTWEGWDSSVGYEYGRHKQTGPTLSQTQDSSVGVGSLPGGYVREYDCSSTHWQNEGAVLAGDRGRLYPWTLTVPERLVGRLGGLRYGTLCPGDGVYLTSGILAGRLEAAGHTLNERRGMVSSHAVDWLRASVAVEISLPPHPTDTEQG